MTELRIIVQSILIFFRVFVCHFFDQDRAYLLARSKWLNGHTFRTAGVNSKKDFFAVPRYYLRALRLLFIQKEKDVLIQEKTIYCQTASQVHQFSGYLYAVKGVEFDRLIFRDETQYKFLWVSRMILVLFLSIISFVLFILSFFSHHRSRLGLIILQWVENTKLILIAHYWAVRKLYFFGGYENDSCYTGLLCRSFNIELVTIPSANPIRNFYQQLVTHTFVITADFQNVEFEKYKDSWEFLKVEQWPFIEFTKLQPFIKGNLKTERNVIGFISRGAWIRKKRGVDAQNNNRDFQYEERCMWLLKRFMQRFDGVKLIIMPHPMECHRPEVKAEAIKFYKDYFENLNVKFYEDGLKTYQCFQNFNVTVTAISSTNIERLYCGYKAMFAPIGSEVEFFSGSTLDNIVCRSEDQFDTMLLDILAKEEDEFFSTYGLMPYRFDAIRTQR